MQSMRMLTSSSTPVFALLGALLLSLTLTSTPAVAADTEEVSEPIPAPVCVFGWSKNTCNGLLKGEVDTYTCQRVVEEEIVDCRTFHIKDAEFRIPIKRNEQGCSGEPCDEVPQLDGTIILRGSFVFGHGDCPFRGAWEGEWRLVDNGGTIVAYGTGSGTLGTGSHRAVGPCILPQGFGCNENCEKCYDVNRFSVGDQFVWQVGFEGALRGEVFAGEWSSSLISISLSGTLNAYGNHLQPYSFEEWHYCGASDGVVLAKCDG